MVTRTEFELYENVRLSGITNMFDIELVSKLTGLTKDVILTIMDDYNEFAEEFK